MVLESKQTTIAYRCPHCGAGVISAVGLFSLSADMMKLKCDCGESEMTVVYSNDGKIRLTVPCIFCPKPHNFVVNTSIFFGRELFVLPCPYSDINICMIGDTNKVKAELARTELELLDILEKSGVDNFDLLHSDGKSLPDPQILDIIMFVIRDLEAEGKISCRCGNVGEGEYEVELLENGILVSCSKCGASKIIPTDSYLAANEFLNSDSLRLE